MPSIRPVQKRTGPKPVVSTGRKLAPSVLPLCRLFGFGICPISFSDYVNLEYAGNIMAILFKLFPLPEVLVSKLT